MQKSCKQCGIEFIITDNDFKFYDKVSPIFNGVKYTVPTPTLCPECRQQRRFAIRNERKLYHRKCDLSGKQIVSNYSPDKKYKTYDIKEWWSDKWDPKSYRRNFDFNLTFFEQFETLQDTVPQLAISVWNSENSNFCNYVGNVKDSYLIFGSVYSEDCYYGSPYYSKNCLDTLVVRECQNSYECIDCRKLYSCFYCQDCHGSNDLTYCYDMQACSNCICCAGLRNKQYHVFNKRVSEEKYDQIRKELNLNKKSIKEKLEIKLDKLKQEIPHRFMQSKKVENVSGNYIYQCKNANDCYYTDRSEDVKYCAQVVDLKDCHDNNFTEENELCYEYLGAYQNSRLLFSKFCNQVSDAFYCDSCFTSKNLFGCIGIRSGEYCIFNKQYSKEEYEELVPRIIEHMQNTEEWGEFFTTSISPFGYNETVAQEYYPLKKEDALSNNWKWYEEDIVEQNYLGPKYYIPNDIQDVDESICDKILQCEKSKKLYKIIPQEFAFYKKMNLPIPRKCPDQRHEDRLSLRNPRRLWLRNCDKCGKEIQTVYSPDRSEIVYCEECYLKEVY